MMRKTIVRTLTKTTIEGYKVTKIDGKPSVEAVEPVTAWGKLTDKEALKAFAEVYGKDSGHIIGEIKYADEVYEIDIDAFVANARKVESEN